MSKLVRKLAFCLAASISFSSVVNAESVKNDTWISRFNNMPLNENKNDTTGLGYCEGYITVSGEIGDSHVTMDTSNQHFYSTSQSDYKKEVFGIYDSKVNSGKLHAGDNEITVYFDSENGFVAGTNVITLHLDKLKQDKPSLKISRRTKNSITVKKVAGCEYKITGSKWQKSNKFTDLKSKKEYKVYIRKVETKTKAASGVRSMKVKTK